MIHPQQSYNPTVASRYHRLAGPFADHEESILTGMLRFLTSTKARVVTVGERDGVCLWRLAAECETMEETEARLRQQALSTK